MSYSLFLSIKIVFAQLGTNILTAYLDRQHPFYNMEKLTVTTQLTIDDFVRVNFHLLYRKISIKFLTGIGVFLLLSALFLLIAQGYFSWFATLFALLLIVGYPAQVYFGARQNYKSNARISEKIIYEFDEEFIQLTGESFTTKLTWEKIYRVTENKDWILIWPNRQLANVIPKTAFKEEELKAFKEIVNLQKGIKNKLKQ
jgi:hypothetical protein